MILIIFCLKGLTSFPVQTVKLFRVSFQSDFSDYPTVATESLIWIHCALLDYAVHHSSWKGEHFVHSRRKMKESSGIKFRCKIVLFLFWPKWLNYIIYLFISNFKIRSHLLNHPKCFYKCTNFQLYGILLSAESLPLYNGPILSFFPLFE